MELKISTTPALLGIKSPRGKLEITQSQPKVEIKSEKPKINMHTQQAFVEIDQYPCRKDVGMKNNQDFSSDMVIYSKEQAAKGLDRIIAQGNQMACIETGIDPIPNQAYENTHLYDKEFNIGFVPKERPIFHVREGKVNIEYTPGKVELSAKISKPNIKYTPKKVEIYLRQKNSIHIEWIGGKFNQIG